VDNHGISGGPSTTALRRFVWIRVLTRRVERNLTPNNRSRRIKDEVKEEAMTQKDSKQNAGIKSLVKKYRAMFEIPENLNHYSEADYKVAEKKFLKYAMLENKVRT
jgi:hypothetical protein